MHEVTLRMKQSSAPLCQSFINVRKPVTTASCATPHADKIFPHPVRRRLQVLAFQYSVTVGTSVMLTGSYLQCPNGHSVCTMRIDVPQQIGCSVATTPFHQPALKCFSAPCRGGNLRPHRAAGAAILSGVRDLHADLWCYLPPQDHFGVQTLRLGLA